MQTETVRGGEHISAPIHYQGIAVLGSHPATKTLAPFERDDWLIYACSPHNFFDPNWNRFFKGKRRQPQGFPHGKLPRFDQWFELHRPITDKTRPYAYLRWLETVPHLWMRDLDSMHHFPGAQLYPDDEVKTRFGAYLFTSSIAYLLAKAIMDCEQAGIKRLGVFGIMQSSNEEYAYQRTGTQHMLLEAERAGIEVVLPDAAEQLLEPPPENW